MSLDTILASGEMLEVVVEIDSALRTIGALKTWYYSTLFRETGSTDTPANTPMPQYLSNVGPLAQGLSEDVLFSGLSTNDPGTIVLFQPLPDVDKLSQLNDYTFIGYQCRITIGLASSTLYTDFVRYRTVTIAAEPDVILANVNSVGGIQATFKLQSVLGKMLEEDLIVNHYVGIPHCIQALTTTFVATAPYISAYALSSFTISFKFKGTIAPSVARNLFTRVQASPLQINFAVQITTTGTIQLVVTIAGVSTTLQSSTVSILDDIWHTITWGLLDKTSSYLMIDENVINTVVPSDTIDTPTSGDIWLGRFQLGKYLDCRLYNTYIPPDEARSIMAIRSGGDDSGVAGLWRFDDNAGGVANDYSTNANDAVLTGTINVNYSWQPTDLGEPELAGRPYLIVIGEVLNVMAQLIDSVRNRFSYNDGGTSPGTDSGLAVLTVRSQGTVLNGVGGADYTYLTGASADGVIAMTAAEAEPITFDHLSTGTSEEVMYPAQVANNLLTTRTRLTSSNIDGVQVGALNILCPWLSGYFANTDTNAQAALQSILGHSGLNYYEDSMGLFVPDFLLPPMGYGPYNEPILDLRGKPDNYVYWPEDVDAAGSITLATWFKTSQLDQTTYNLGGAEPNSGSFFLISKGSAGANYALYYQSVGVNSGRFAFAVGGTILYSPPGLVIEANKWYFISSVFDYEPGNSTLIFYAAEFGSSLVLASSVTTSANPVTDDLQIRIGASNHYCWGAVQHVQIWGVAKTLSQLQALMNTPPIGNETSLLFYAPINEGMGNPLNAVTGSSGIINGTPQWAPKLLVNLNDTPSVRLIEFHHLKPVYDAKVQYAHNRHPMTDSDIDTGITGDSRIALKREWKTALFNNPTIRSRFKDARKIVLNSSITDRESAQHLLRALADRFGTDQYIGVLEFTNDPEGSLNISRQACGLKLMDEIGIIGAIPSQISVARSFRGVSVNHNPITLSTTIGFTG